MKKQIGLTPFLGWFLIGCLFLAISNSFAVPVINLNPLQLNSETTNESQKEIGVDLIERNLDTFIFNWNGLNYTFLSTQNRSTVLYSGDYNSLILALTFNNGNSTDFSRYNSSCVAKDNPTSNMETGKFGDALSFDGKDNVINCGNGSQLNLKELSIELWYKTSYNESHSYLVEKLSGGWGWDTGYGVFLTYGKPDLILGYNSSAGTSYGQFIIDKNESFDGNWHYVVYTAKSNGNVRGYFDGSLFTEWDFPYQIKTNTKDISIGGSKLWQKFNGSIDEVRIYNRSLSHEEILLHNSFIFTRSNSIQYRLISNLSLWTGLHNYYAWANNSDGDSFKTGSYSLDVPCITPKCGLKIFKSTKLCPGEYDLNPLDNTCISIEGSNLTLSGNNTLIMGVSLGRGLEAKNQNNLKVQNLSLADFYNSIYLNNVVDSQFDNLILGQSNWKNLSYGFYGKGTNITVKNSKFENYTNYPLFISGSKNMIIENTFSHFSSIINGSDGGIYCVANSTTIKNNIFDTLDRGVFIVGWRAKNITIANNFFINMTTNADSYDVGVLVYDGPSGIAILNNTFQKIGTVAILVQKNCSGIEIRDNSIDMYNLSMISNGVERINSDDNGEPPSAILISSVYKKMLGDCTEKFSDNLTKITNYGSENIQITGNTFGPNVQIPLRLQGNHNVTHDLGNYIHTKIQILTHLLEFEEFYISKSSNNITEKRGSSITDIHDKGYGDYSQKIIQSMIQYKLNRSSLFFRNMNDSIVYNISLFVPNNVLFNLSCKATPTQVNASLPTNMQWYHTINFTITPSSGISTVLVSDYTEKYSSWSIQGGSGSINYEICSLKPSSTYLLKDGGLGVLTLQSSSSGCVSFVFPAYSSKKLFDLVLIEGGGADLQIASFRVPLVVGLGSSVYVSGDIKNQGTVSSGVFYARFYEGADVKASIRVPSLAPGALYTVDASWTPSEGSHVVRLSADYNNSVSERNESNNDQSYSYVSGSADLSVISADINLLPSLPVLNDHVNITVRAYNGGGTPAYGVSVRCFDGPPGANVLIGSTSVDIPAGDHAYIKFPWVASPINTHGIYVVLDRGNAISESNENNNMALRNIQVLSLADLSVSASDITFTPSVVRAGSGALVTATVKNLGDAAASFVVRFIDGVLAVAERTISLDGETNVAVSIPWNATSPGSHDLSVSLDPANRVSEQSEANNLAVKTVSVQQSTTSTLSANPITTVPVFSTTTIVYPPMDGCVMPGNGLPCNEVALAEVISGITLWAQGGMSMNDVVALINSWADQSAYPPN
jgi:hypothetical protein